MKRSDHNEWIVVIRVEASYGARYDQPDAYDNYVFLDQIQEADEIWQTTKAAISSSELLEENFTCTKEENNQDILKFQIPNSTRNEGEKTLRQGKIIKTLETLSLHIR